MSLVPEGRTIKNDETSSQRSGRGRLKLALFVYLIGLIAIYLMALYLKGGDVVRFLNDIWVFGPIGVGGAIIANSTGTGGGVVFVPVFNALNGASQMGMIPMEIAVSERQTIGISFLIQCFGMSIGSLAWIYRFYGGGEVHPHERFELGALLSIVFTVLATAIPALLITQVAFFGNVDGKSLLTLFKWVSLLLGIVLLVLTWVLKRSKPVRFEPELTDTYALLVLGAVGGVVTAFFSVGVGELVAVYLIIRKFPTVPAVAASVIISAVVVICGVGYHIGSLNIVWPIALMAIPGAVIGGFIAKYFALWLGPLWLKTFASLWIIVSSAYLIAGPYFSVMPG